MPCMYYVSRCDGMSIHLDRLGRRDPKPSSWLPCARRITQPALKVFFFPSHSGNDKYSIFVHEEGYI